ncbi:right-handed parallel beta-helix repeat-containing protein [Candidatus Sumerlaeota bacterium]|nr:right-handed parallel beta-helix repeat-containing protein [Candidatus Sumerlaeota bacterium]
MNHRILLRASFALVLATAAVFAPAAEYYVATTGVDTNPGTALSPFGSVAKAISVVNPGDTVWVHGGEYEPTDSIRLTTKSGTQAAPIRIWAVPGEQPVFEFHGLNVKGIRIEQAWWRLKGLTVAHCGDYGIRLQTVNAHHVTLENMTCWRGGNSGIGLTAGAHDNLLLNCDSYEHYDVATHGENADGFALKSGIGTGNRLIGCRAWHNSDDGYDLWKAGESVYLERCYAWRNGDNVFGDPDFDGNMNGFKLGQDLGAHVLYRCAVWDEPKKGFDLNGNSSGVTIRQCTAFRCEDNFAFLFVKGNAELNVLRNNLSFQGNVEIDPRMDDQHNSWNTAGVTIGADDFVSLDPSSLEGPRNADGSLPEGPFLQLAPESDAIDAGVDLGLPYEGDAPDLGAFETAPKSLSVNAETWESMR